MRDADNSNGGNEAGLAEVGEDLEVTSVTRRGLGGGGLWVDGRLAGHRFQALVFPERASNPEFEVGGDSRISKLWVQRLSDRAEVYSWDRGEDVAAADAMVATVVAFLCDGLAESVYNR